MTGEVCAHCGEHYWLRNADGRFCGNCGMEPYRPPTLRQLLREAMESGRDPIGDSFEHVGRVMLATFGVCGILLAAIVLAVNT